MNNIKIPSFLIKMFSELPSAYYEPILIPSYNEVDFYDEYYDFDNERYVKCMKLYFDYKYHCACHIYIEPIKGKDKFYKDGKIIEKRKRFFFSNLHSYRMKSNDCKNLSEEKEWRDKLKDGDLIDYKINGVWFQGTIKFVSKIYLVVNSHEFHYEDINIAKFETYTKKSTELLEKQIGELKVSSNTNLKEWMNNLTSYKVKGESDLLQVISSHNTRYTPKILEFQDILVTCIAYLDNIYEYYYREFNINCKTLCKDDQFHYKNIVINTSADLFYRDKLVKKDVKKLDFLLGDMKLISDKEFEVNCEKFIISSRKLTEFYLIKERGCFIMVDNDKMFV